MTDKELLKLAIEDRYIKINKRQDRIEYLFTPNNRSEVWSHPEEKVRCKWILRLIYVYEYDPECIDVEVKVPDRVPGRTADVVVFRDGEHKQPYLVVECAAPNQTVKDRKQKIEQGFGYANAMRSEYVMYFEGNDTKTQCWQLAGYPSGERKENLIHDVPKRYGEVDPYLLLKGSTSDIAEVDNAELNQRFKQCHRELWAGGKNDPVGSFDEMCKIIFAKLHDELSTGTGEPYRFQCGRYESEHQIAEKVRLLYEEAKRDRSSVFRDELVIGDKKLVRIVGVLQDISLEETDPDAKGQAYEQFLGAVFRGGLGQYFTRRELINFILEMVECQPSDRVLDPACGSGGFLVNLLKQKIQEIERKHRGNFSIIERNKQNYAQNCLYGIEINDKIARVAMMGMVIHDDGHTNIEVTSALNRTFENEGIGFGKFDRVLTNPPFGDKVALDDEDKLGDSTLEDFDLYRGTDSVKSELLFIEQCTKFLKKNGVLGIVLPDGVFNNPSMVYVREYLFKHYCVDAVISLPNFAFRKAGAGMKTSILIATKGKKQSTKVFMAIADHIGYDSTGRPDTNDLHDIVLAYQTGDITSIDELQDEIRIKSVP